MQKAKDSRLKFAMMQYKGHLTALGVMAVTPLQNADFICTLNPPDMLTDSSVMD